MNSLGYIFQKKHTVRRTRSANGNKLCQPVPGHPEVAANKLAQAWNLMNLSNAKTLGCAKTYAKNWCKQNANSRLI